MASDVVANPPTTAGESKSARKKKAKAEAAATAVPAPTEKATSEFGASGSDPAGKANGADSENFYIKELQKGVRNVNKKLNAMHKVTSIVEANPGVSIDDLLASRKINADQKAQLQKKPALQAQLAELEEQLAQYKKFEQEYQHKAAQEKEMLQKAHSEELETLRDTLKVEAALEQKKAFREKFLTLSRFLRAAAARRQLEEDDSDLTKAFEGALLLVYGGDAGAVGAAEKLIDGTEDSVPSTEGTALSVTYAQIKQASLDEAPFAAEEAWVDDVAQSQPAAPETEASTDVSADPTLVNAGLTELDTTAPAVNGATESADTPSAPPTSSVDTGAANAAAEEQWDKQQTGSDDPLAESYEMVPRDPAETETPAVAAPLNSVQSWADDTPEPAPAATAPPTNGNDGFHEVHHNRGGRGRGGHQGEGRGGGYRGRGGPRGDFRGGRGGRGRGRGDFRGGPRGSFRGGRGESQ